MSNRRKPVEMLLQLLVHGGEIKFNGHTYVMHENQVCIVTEHDEHNERLDRIDMTVHELCSMAEKIGKDELWLAVCGLQLRSINESKREKKELPIDRS